MGNRIRDGTGKDEQREKNTFLPLKAVCGRRNGRNYNRKRVPKR